MKKSLTLALALVALAVFSGVGLAQRKGEEKKPAAASMIEQQALQQQVNKLTQTAFTYQGQLKEGSVRANGAYTFRLALYTAQSGGHQLGVVIKDDVVVTNGSFTVQLDFGREGLSSNESWLEVGVRPANSTDPYTALSPRQRLTSTPYAIQGQAEPWSRIGVPVGFQRGVDAGHVTADKIADDAVTGAKIAEPQAVTGINSPRDAVALAAGDNATVTPGGNMLPIAAQGDSGWTIDKGVVRLARETDSVGIGTKEPTAKLDVDGSIRARGPIRSGNSMTFNGLDHTITATDVLSQPFSKQIRIGFSITPIPNPVTFPDIKVGIGTLTPTQELTLGAGNILVPNANGGTDGNLYFGGITDNGQVGMRLFGGLVNGSIPSGFIDVRAGTPSDGLIFRVDGNIGGTERMRITASGNVGIGTASPTNTLDVNGKARIRGLTPSPLLNDVVVADPSGVLFTRPANTLGGGSWSLTGNTLTTGNEFLGTINAFPLRVFTNSSEKMRILTNGNVGIGTITPNEQLEITRNFRLPASTASAGVIKSGANRFIHNFGVFNFFAGVDAGNFTMTGCCNTAVGKDAFQSNTAGVQNTVLGRGALKSSTIASDNTAIGNRVLESNTTGHNNTAVGSGALISTTTGRENIALGVDAGNGLTTGSFNIDIGNGGAPAESSTIRIGTFGKQTRTFIAGIFNTVLGAQPNVVINSSGQLGIAVSSRRFKEHIENMGAASEVLYHLRPVSFLYKPEYGGRPDLPQFGLIAEDVAKVAPELVAYDDQGQPLTVHYQFLAPMLLNELQKKDTEIGTLRARLDALERLVEGLTKK